MDMDNKSAQSAREKRLAQQLRANLMRRKAQARQRQDPQPAQVDDKKPSSPQE